MIAGVHEVNKVGPMIVLFKFLERVSGQLTWEEKLQQSIDSHGFEKELAVWRQNRGWKR